LDWNSLGDDLIEDETAAGDEVCVIEEADDVDVSDPIEAATQKVDISLFKIRNWPEFKVETKKQCRKVFGRKICVNLPQAFQRNCELMAIATISHPSASSIRRKIENCARQAVAAGVVAGIISGNLAAAAAALKGYLITCLSNSGVSEASRITVKVRTETKCGKWKPR
jgi:hypothetical protein